MRSILAVLALSVLLLPTGLSARPPVTEALADCAALVNLSNRHAPHRARTQTGRALDSFSYRFADRAMREARRAGIDVEAVEDLLAARAAYWTAKGTRVARDPEFRMVLATCRPLMADRTLRMASAG